MQTELPNQRRLSQPGRAILAAALAALWFCFSLFASSPELHHFLHKDSQDGSHTCALTQLGKGSLANDPGQADVITAPRVPWALPRASESPDLPKLYSPLLSGRAPPFSSSSATVEG
jgi:hypothetical protein